MKKEDAPLRIVIDEELCAGCNLCEEICPQVFSVVKDLATVKTNPLTQSIELLCRNAAKRCPVHAISIQQ